MKYWPLVLGILTFAVGYGALAYSVHANVVDDAITHEFVRQGVESNSIRIARLEQAISEIPEIKKDVKELLRRVH